MKKSPPSLEVQAQTLIDEIASLKLENAELAGPAPAKWRLEKAGILRDAKIDNQTAERMCFDLDRKAALVPNRIERNLLQIEERELQLRKLCEQIGRAFSADLDRVLAICLRDIEALISVLEGSHEGGENSEERRHKMAAKVWEMSEWCREFKEASDLLDRSYSNASSILQGVERLRAFEGRWLAKTGQVVQAVKAVA